jgi:hypothetical protein
MNSLQYYRHHFKNALIDVASVILLLAILYVCAQGFTTLYKSWYETGNLSPDVFQAASFQFSGAIGLVYTLQLTRKHYSPLPPPETKVESEGSARLL